MPDRATRPRSASASKTGRTFRATAPDGRSRLAIPGGFHEPDEGRRPPRRLRRPGGGRRLRTGCGYAIRAPFSTGNVGSSNTTPWVSDTAPRMSTSDFTPAIRFGGKFVTATICLPISVSGR